MSSQVQQNNSEIPHGRRWFQFRMRSILALTFLVGCGMGWIAWERAKNARYQAGVKVIRQFGGHAVIVGELPKGPALLRNIIGADSSRPVLGVSFVGAQFTDSDLDQLQGISNLQNLWLLRTSISDEQLKYVKGFCKINKLWLCDSTITDAGMHHVNDILRLDLLNVTGTKVTEVGIQRLGALARLKCLVVDYHQFSKDGLAKFKKEHPGFQVTVFLEL